MTKSGSACTPGVNLTSSCVLTSGSGQCTVMAKIVAEPVGVATSRFAAPVGRSARHLRQERCLSSQNSQV